MSNERRGTHEGYRTGAGQYKKNQERGGYRAQKINVRREGVVSTTMCHRERPSKVRTEKCS